MRIIKQCAGWVILVALFSVSHGLHAESQRLPVELKGTAGYSLFPDDTPLHHFVGGGSVRLYFTQRLAFEPEFLYMYRNASDQDFHFIPNIAFDLTPEGHVSSPMSSAGRGWSCIVI